MAIRRVWGRSGLGPAIFLVLVAWGPPGPARAADRLVTLDGWEGQGSLIPGAGMMNGDLVRLIVEARWEAAAPRDALRYAVRATFPDGRSETRAFSLEEPPGRSRFVAYVPAGPLRNRAPSEVRVELAVVDAATGGIVSNPIVATIDQFPRFRGDATLNDDRPFGWGTPLPNAPGAAPLPRTGPDGLAFVRVAQTGPAAPSFFLSRTEATVAEVIARLPDYNPKAGRSDEFNLESGEQPAVGLTPARALEFLKALSANDPSGVTYRLPTSAEWNRAARGPKPDAPFWWGDEATHPEGANLLGAEPALDTDTTAPSLPLDDVSPRFVANPFGLFHTFGNVAEWAGAPEGGFARLGGHFRTEPASPLPEPTVAKDDDLGGDPFVGVRPAFSLTPPAVEGLVRDRLVKADPRLSAVQAAYDPERSVVTLVGRLEAPATRRLADSVVEGLWFVAAVDNRIETPRPFPGQVAILAPSGDPARVESVLDRSFVDCPVEVRWFDPLPVVGSDWWVNIYLPSGEHLFHKLTETEGGRSPRAIVSVDRARLRLANLPDDAAFSVAISLGRPAPTTADPNLVSNVLLVRPVLRGPVFR